MNPKLSEKANKIVLFVWPTAKHVVISFITTFSDYIAENKLHNPLSTFGANSLSIKRNNKLISYIEVYEIPKRN